MAGFQHWSDYHFSKQHKPVEPEDIICTCHNPNPNFMGSGILLCTNCGDPIEGGPDEPEINWLVPLDYDLVYEAL